MVAIEEIVDDSDSSSSSPPPSQERLWDAEDIEKILSQLKRPTAKMHVESLVKKIRKEASALKALESTSTSTSTTNHDTTAPTTKAAPSPTSAAVAAAAAKQPIRTGPSTMNYSPSLMYNSIDRFAFDAGGSSDKFVTLYLPLPGVGSLPKKDQKDKITCDFGKDSFDVTVIDIKGKNYRLKRDNLEYDIVPEKSKYIVKADKIVVKLHKVKGEYGSFDFWSKLTDPKRKEKKKSSRAADPSAGLMDMMKDMYDSGDDKMKKMIGETMTKQRNGELDNDKNKQPGGGLGAGLEDMNFGM